MTHRAGIRLCVFAAFVLCAWMAVYGFGYYRLGAAARISSPKHAELKPSGAIGHRIGILGAALFALIYLYPLRKRWGWLSRRGKTKNWLDYHILMGLTAPVLITFHSAFKLRGIAGLAYWIMIAVVLSGIVGRYLYGRIPRRLDQAEMSLDEMRELSLRLARELKAQTAIPFEKIAPIFELPRPEQVQAMPLARAIPLIVALDLRRWFRMWKLRAGHGRSEELNRALAAVRKQAALTKDILFLSKMKQTFHLWHVIHRPFSYSFAVLVVLHISVVFLLGYY